MTLPTNTVPAVEAVPTGLWIGGSWQEPESGEWLPGIDPATGRPLAPVACAGPADVERAVTAAHAAFERHRDARPVERERWLRGLGDALLSHVDRLALVTTQDMGMPLDLARQQVVAAAELCHYTAGWATKLYGEVVYPSTSADYHAFVDREPLGVVAAIVPWNAPILLTMLKLAPALACGNSIVVKPSEDASLTLLALAQVIEESGVPAGMVSVISGRGAVAGAGLVSHPLVAKVSVTGSVATGQAILRLSADTLKPVTLELGGKSPNIVCADADLDVAVPESAWGVFAFSGQLCVAGTRIFVQRSRYDEFVGRLCAFAENLLVGDGRDPATQVGPLVSRRQLDQAQGYVHRATADGLRLATVGTAPDTDAGGFFMAPHVFADVGNASELAQEEIFGPVACVLPFDDLEEAVALANDSRFGLAAGLWSQDVDTVHRTVRRLQAGVVWVNGYLASDPSMPFGGTKMSGLGREKGRQVLEEYTRLKSIWVRLR